MYIYIALIFVTRVVEESKIIVTIKLKKSRVANTAKYDLWSQYFSWYFFLGKWN